MARLFLSDTFYEAVLALPKSAQKKVVAFQKKFRENTTTNGLHLEPVHQFKNDAMRTARVDDNYRAVIGVMGGENYYLLYVGAHEDAYNWGTSKTIEWNAHTQAVQLIPVVEAKNTAAIEVPSSASGTALPFKDVPSEKLLKIGVPEALLERVAAIKDLDGLAELEKSLPTDAFENVFNVLDGGNINDLIKEIEEGLAKANEDQLLSDNNKRRFVELTDDDDLQRILDQDMDKWQLFLHPSQRKLVEADYKGTMKVSGGAGTGKTVAALHRLKCLCGKPGAKVLFTTYTRTLKENLDGLVKKLDVNASRCTLNNIDQVLLECAKAYKVKEGCRVLDYAGDDESLKLWREVLETEVTEFDERFLYDEYVDVILYFGNSDVKAYMTQQRVGRSKALNRKQRVEIWKLVEKYVALKAERKVVDRLELFNETAKYLNANGIRPYTNVIADEFQDFSNPELKFLRALVAEGGNDLFLVGDPLQRIYTGRKINFSSAGINVKGFRSRRLKINYRTTEPIRRVAVSVIKGLKFDDMDGGAEATDGYVSLIRSGETPRYVLASDPADEIVKVIDWIAECRQTGVAAKDICVAAPSLALMKGLQSRLHTDGVEYKVLKGGSKSGSDKGISLCTLHSIKGLEFKVVVLMGINERNLPSREVKGYPFDGMDAVDRREFLASKRSLLYVAITRARQLVYITGSGEPCGLLPAAGS